MFDHFDFILHHSYDLFMDKKIKRPLYALIPVILVSCGPSRNAAGDYWKPWQVWRCVTAGPDKIYSPGKKIYTCPSKP